jgi:hypothetical protein
MDTIECTTNPIAKMSIHAPSPSRDANEKMTKTPESELMTVEEYFGILRKRVNEYYYNL